MGLHGNVDQALGKARVRKKTLFLSCDFKRLNGYADNSTAIVRESRGGLNKTPHQEPPGILSSLQRRISGRESEVTDKFGARGESSGKIMTLRQEQSRGSREDLRGVGVGEEPQRGKGHS